MTRAGGIVTVVLVGAIVVSVGAPHAHAQPMNYELVSVSSAGMTGNGVSSWPTVSADGRWVAFESTATNLVAGDTNAVPDIFLRDRQTAQTIRISLGPNGLEANGASSQAHISADGRYVAFASLATNLVPDDTNGVSDVFLYDRQTDQVSRVSVTSGGGQADDFSTGARPSADGRYIAFTSFATNLVPGDTNNACTPGPSRTPNCPDVFLHDRVTATTARISTTPAGGDSNGASALGAISASGCEIAFTSTAGNLTASDTNASADVFVYDCHTRSITLESASPLGAVFDAYGPALSPDGRWLVFGGNFRDPVTQVPLPQSLFLRDRTTGTTERVGAAVPPGFIGAVAVSDGGDLVVTAEAYRQASAATVVNRVTGVAASHFSDACPAGAAFSLPLVVASVTCDDGVRNIYGQIVAQERDTDRDGMDDWYEAWYGLDPSSAADAVADPDGDGATNAQEYAAGSHPRGTAQRYFAEGATVPPFDTRVDLFNPSATDRANVLVTYQRADGSRRRAVAPRDPLDGYALGAFGSWGLATLPGLEREQFSTFLESDHDIVATRTMDWGADQHAESAIEAPATTWYFAEGATHSNFQLFYLVQNPGDAPATVTATWMRPAPAPPSTSTYVVAAHSRRTIWVNFEEPALANADVAASFDADRPVVVERSMYVLNASGTLGAGHGAAGSTSPSTDWFFGEGATGSLFDLFVLLANPGAASATVRVTYLLPDGTTIPRDYAVAARSRRTVWVDLEDARLANTAVSTIVHATNGVPVVAERAMWWPGPTPATWTSTHVSHGATATGTLWAYAGAPDGTPAPPQVGASTASYVLIANTSPFDGEVRVQAFPQTTSVPIERTYTLAASSRLTLRLADVVSPSISGAVRLNVIVESTGSAPAQVVVEVATYTDVGGVPMRAGTNALATRLR